MSEISGLLEVIAVKHWHETSHVTLAAFGFFIVDLSALQRPMFGLHHGLSFSLTVP